jgi:NAD(P)-dependent dehydrogenase (short-subunit alcohol dehydrogenase family)
MSEFWRIRFGGCVGGRNETNSATPKRSLEEALAAAVPLGRLLNPEHLAASVLFLCSPNAVNITGALLVVDGEFNLTH